MIDSEILDTRTSPYDGRKARKLAPSAGAGLTRLRIGNYRVSRHLLIGSTVLLGACAARVTPHLPPLRPLDETAQIVVIRNRNLFGSAVRVSVLLDGFEVAQIHTGQYIEFSVDAGVHSVGTRSTPLSISFEKGQRYYFLITPAGDSGTFEIERLTPEEGERRAQDAERVSTLDMSVSLHISAA